MVPRSTASVLLLACLLSSAGLMGQVTLPDPTQPLHAAAYGGELAKAKALLAEGADIDARDEHGCTALIWAITGKQPATAISLIEQRADVNGACISPRTGAELYTPLCVAAKAGNTDVLRALLEAGAKVDFEGVGGQPVHWAAREGHGEILWLLNNHGASLYAADPNGKRPLKIAWESGHRRVGGALFWHDLKVIAKLAWTELCTWWLGMWVYLRPIVLRFAIPLLVFSIFMVLFCHRLALEKNKCVPLWTVLGAIPVLNIVSLLYLVGASNIALERKVDRLLHMIEVYTLHGPRQRGALVLDDETLDRGAGVGLAPLGREAPLAPEPERLPPSPEDEGELLPPKEPPLEPADPSDESKEADKLDAPNQPDDSDQADSPQKTSTRIKTSLPSEESGEASPRG